ncbi:YcgL domain-containing protein B0F88_107153 [Candidatus Methylobacter favarea]|uniref:YcgL domain-containing protein METHB2_580011 n=1 Tax=Candidatus Methylobacter favarea TaxID=2707345 RepID=A0A8S0Y6S7_9GAMM|nr:YcgL domain-containing protein [Candidatus Methylobacter favarea]CAA9892069.1 YcgL domain-containing protein B0F88_107153 [Candidatus Methylobacter favarea]
MQCFIYKSLKKEYLYLYIDKKDDFSRVPDLLFNSLGKLEFVMELELFPERKLAREDAGKVIQSLKEKGFFVQMPPSKVSSPLKIQ